MHGQDLPRRLAEVFASISPTPRRGEPNGSFEVRALRILTVGRANE